MKHWIAGTCLLLAGCGNSAIDGCEQFIKGSLAAPSTYRRIEVTEANVPTNQNKLLALGKDPRIVAFEKRMGIADRPLTLHSVLITYEANNAFNAPLRDRKVCWFEGQEPVESNIKIGVSRAEIHGSGQCCLL